MAAAGLVAAVALLAVSCGGSSGFVVGATTSVQDTGLLDALIEAFRDQPGDIADVRPIVAGSGQILELARRGEVDAVMTHSPSEEAKLVADGDGLDRRPFMQNFFRLVGPAEDPAGVRGAGSIDEAFALIADAGATFISRGDQSGTHIRELAIWERVGVDPAGESWYQESGAGQGQSLLVASDKGAYTLVDSSTFTVFRERLVLEVYATDAEPNQYSVVRVNPERHDVHAEAALAFADFLTSPTAQAIIDEFGREEYGQPLFAPITAPATGSQRPEGGEPWS